MPIKIPTGLPAGDILHSENIFVMDENRAMQQDIRAGAVQSAPGDELQFRSGIAQETAAAAFVAEGIHHGGLVGFSQG